MFSDSNKAVLLNVKNKAIIRVRLFALASLCTVVIPIIMVLLWCHTLFGNEDFAIRTATGIDQSGNAAIGGSQDETFSSRTGRAQEAGVAWGVKLAPVIDTFFGKDHCKKSIGI